MKRHKLFFLSVFTMLTTMLNAAQVIWRHSFSPNAVILNGSNSYTIEEYTENILGDSLYNVAYMVIDLTSGEYLNFRFDGFDPDSMNWVEGTGGYPYIIVQDAIVGNVETDGGHPIWNSFDGNWGDVVVQLSLYDEETDSFELFAVSDAFTLSTSSRGVGAYGTVESPATEVWLEVFHSTSPVPEPSVLCFFFVGVGLLLMIRKTFAKEL